MRYHGIPQVVDVDRRASVPITRGPRIRSGVHRHRHSLRSSCPGAIGTRGFPRAKTHDHQLTITSMCQQFARRIAPFHLATLW